MVKRTLKSNQKKRTTRKHTQLKNKRNTKRNINKKYNRKTRKQIGGFPGVTQIKAATAKIQRLLVKARTNKIPKDIGKRIVDIEAEHERAVENSRANTPQQVSEKAGMIKTFKAKVRKLKGLAGAAAAEAAAAEAAAEAAAAEAAADGAAAAATTAGADGAADGAAAGADKQRKPSERKEELHKGELRPVDEISKQTEYPPVPPPAKNFGAPPPPLPLPPEMLTKIASTEEKGVEDDSGIDNKLSLTTLTKPAANPTAKPAADPAIQEEDLKKMFEKFDKDGDGMINVREMLLGLRKDEKLAAFLKMPHPVRQEDGTREEFEKRFQVMDRDGNRNISFEEFKKFLLSAADPAADPAQPQAPPAAAPAEQKAQAAPAEQKAQAAQAPAAVARRPLPQPPLPAQKGYCGKIQTTEKIGNKVKYTVEIIESEDCLKKF